MYSIYKHTLPNGKVYIGQTKQKPYKRWCGGSGYNNKSNEEFYEDILKYGWKNIKHEILAEVDTKEKALKLERFYIIQFNSDNPEYGYNKHNNHCSISKKKNFIQCVETGKVYKSLREAAEEVEGSHQSINLAIKNNTKFRGYHWQYIQPDKVTD